MIPQVVQHIRCYSERVAGGVTEHGVSGGPDRLRDVRLQVVQPVRQVGVRKKSGPAGSKTHATLQRNHQLVGDPPTIVT